MRGNEYLLLSLLMYHTWLLREFIFLVNFTKTMIRKWESKVLSLFLSSIAFVLFVQTCSKTCCYLSLSLSVWSVLCENVAFNVAFSHQQTTASERKPTTIHNEASQQCRQYDAEYYFDTISRLSSIQRRDVCLLYYNHASIPLYLITL